MVLTLRSQQSPFGDNAAMNHYEKIGMFASRLIGMFLAIYGAYSLVVLQAFPIQTFFKMMLIVPFLLIVIGLALFIFAKPIGQLLGGDLD